MRNVELAFTNFRRPRSDNNGRGSSRREKQSGFSAVVLYFPRSFLSRNVFFQLSKYPIVRRS